MVHSSISFQLAARLPTRLPKRLATLSIAISGLLMVPLSYAATIGKTNINSAQHETISASIDVSDIDPDSFSVNVAPNAVYQRMNMSSKIPVKVRFVKTSNTTGKIIVTSAQPVSDPFADVVLTVNDKGRQQTVPKTLLLPLGNKIQNQPNKPTTKVLGASAQPNLPIISAAPATAQPIYKPLQVNRKAPPSLTTSATTSTSVSSNKSLSNQPNNALLNQLTSNGPTLAAKPQVATSTPMSGLIQPGKPILESLGNQGMPAASAPPVNNQIDTNNALVSPSLLNPAYPKAENSDLPALVQTQSATNLDNAMPSTKDKQMFILTTTITRNYTAIKPSTDPATGAQIPLTVTATDAQLPNSAASSPLLANKSINEQTALSDTQELNSTLQTPSNSTALDILASTPPKLNQDSQVKTDTPAVSDAVAKTSDSKAATSKPSAGKKDKVGIPLGDATYTVQKNDNLWTIAQQIATQNNMSISEVMQQIQTYNSDAFIDGNKNKLMANVQLELPAYQVIPSKLGVKAARQAKQANRQASNSQTHKTPAKSVTKPAQTTPKKPQQANQASKPATTRPSLKLVTPGQNGKSTGTGSSSAANNQQNGVSSTLVATLKTSRQKTAAQAQRVSSLSEKLAQSNLTMQVNNDKLASLQKRLKELNAK